MKDILRHSLQGTIACTLVLGLLQPFGIDQLQEGRILFILGQSLCVFVCSIISDYLTRKLLPNLYAKRATSSWEIVKRLVPSFTLITLILPAVLLCFNCWFNEGKLFSYWFNEKGFTIAPYFEFLPLIALVSVVIFVGLFFVTLSGGLKDELAELRELNRLLEERQEREPEETSTPQEETQKCILESSTNNITLELNPNDIIYIESMSNYADVCYLENGETRHKTLRITMKQLRESLSNVDYLLSCHRAFIVNIHFIVSISTRPSGGYQLQIFGQEIQIPVARAYTDDVKQRIAQQG